MRFEFRGGVRGDEPQWEPQKAQKHKRGTTGDSQFKGEQGTTGDSQFRGEMGATKGTKTQKASRVQLAIASSKAQKHERGTTGDSLVQRRSADDKVVLTFTSHVTGWGGLSKKLSPIAG